MQNNTVLTVTGDYVAGEMLQVNGTDYLKRVPVFVVINVDYLPQPSILVETDRKGRFDTLWQAVSGDVIVRTYERHRKGDWTERASATLTVT